MSDYVTSDELQKQLENLADELGISVSELMDAIQTNFDGVNDALTNLNNLVAGNTAAINAITEMDDNGVQSLAEKIKALNDMFSEDGELVTDILAKIAANNQATVANEEAIAGVASDLADYVEANDASQASQDNRMTTIESTASDLADKVADLEEAANEATDGLADRVEVLEANQGVLLGDSTVEGSVDYKVAAEATRAKNVSGALADLVTDEKGTLVGAINEVQAERDATQADVEAVKTRATALEADVATLNGDSTVDGSVAKSIKDAKDAMEASTQESLAGVQSQLDLINGDVETEGSVDYKIAQAATQSNEVTDAIEEEIADLSAQAQAERDALAARIKVTEDTLNDTTDENDDLVKGIKTRVSDCEAAAANEIARATEVEADLQAQLDEVSSATSGLLSGIICGRKAANFFRTRVGQDAKDFDCGSSDDGDGEAV